MMFFKEGQIKKQIHTFNCIHCDGEIEVVENEPEVNIITSASCPYCNKKITYSFLQKQCWDYVEYKKRQQKHQNPYKMVLLK